MLLLYSLHLAGAAIDEHAVIHQNGGPRIPVVAGPIQWVRAHVDALGTRAAARALRREHPNLGGVQHIDLRITLDLLRRVERHPAACKRARARGVPEPCAPLAEDILEAAPLLRNRMVRGLAGAQKLVDSGLAMAGCRHCGAAESSDFHLLLVCLRFQERRPRELILKIKDPMILPLALRDFGMGP